MYVVVALCGDSEYVDWFVSAEARLFVHRQAQHPPATVLELLRNHGVTYSSCRANECGLTANELTWLRHNHSECHELIQVPLPDAPTLLRSRRVLVKRGVCHVHPADMVHVAAFHFKQSLRQQLHVQHQAMATNRMELERLKPILTKFRVTVNKLLNQNRNSATEQPARITLANMDAMAETHFPMCMKQLHRKLREHHHLKYDGRLQYQLFLKSVGVSVQDSMILFRDELTQVMAPSKFDKEYAYGIRHSYGLVGSRKDYGCMTCDQLIHGTAPRQGQFHGCPFKHAHQDALLRQWPSELAHVVSRHIARGDPKAACTSLFRGLHGHPDEDNTLGNKSNPVHFVDPAGWLAASLRHKGKRATSDGGSNAGDQL